MKNISRKDSFFSLDHNTVLNSLDGALSEIFGSKAAVLDKRCTGRLLALNSIENRVYSFDTEDGSQFVAKFYRPARWSADQLQEEHDFLDVLNEFEVPVVQALKADHSRTLFESENGIRFCIFPKVQGRLKDELSDFEVEILGRLLARLHIAGKNFPFKHRLEMNIDTWLWDSVDFLDAQEVSDSPMAQRYLQMIDENADSVAAAINDLKVQSVHGDCHCGNVLWNAQGPYFTDFDDCITAAPVQDLWMILRGRGVEEDKRRESFLSAYTEINDFDHDSLDAIEALRILRMLHYNAWIAKRWEDPSFPRLFPNYGSPEWWRSEIEALHEGLEALHGSNF